MARHDHARIAERAAIALGWLAVNDCDFESAPRAVRRAAKSDHAAADDEDAFAHGRMPQQNGSLSFNRSVASAFTNAEPVMNG